MAACRPHALEQLRKGHVFLAGAAQLAGQASGRPGHGCQNEATKDSQAHVIAAGGWKGVGGEAGSGLGGRQGRVMSKEGRTTRGLHAGQPEGMQGGVRAVQRLQQQGGKPAARCAPLPQPCTWFQIAAQRSEDISAEQGSSMPPPGRPTHLTPTVAAPKKYPAPFRLFFQPVMKETSLNSELRFSSAAPGNQGRAFKAALSGMPCQRPPCTCAGHRLLVSGAQRLPP